MRCQCSWLITSVHLRDLLQKNSETWPWKYWFPKSLKWKLFGTYFFPDQWSWSRRPVYLKRTTLNACFLWYANSCFRFFSAMKRAELQLGPKEINSSSFLNSKKKLKNKTNKVFLLNPFSTKYATSEYWLLLPLVKSVIIKARAWHFFQLHCHQWIGDCFKLLTYHNIFLEYSTLKRKWLFGLTHPSPHN